jgi:hypothetical protein
VSRHFYFFFFKKKKESWGGQKKKSQVLEMYLILKKIKSAFKSLPNGEAKFLCKMTPPNSLYLL